MTKHDTTPDPLQGNRILVVDDIEVNQHLALLILEDAGYQVDIVKNGQQAVETYQQNHFDLILMDIQMPLMDGYEATEKIRNLESERLNKIGNNSDSISKIHVPHSAFKQVPIIAMTGDVAESTLDNCRKKGMNGCIAKPLQRDRLLAAVTDDEFCTGIRQPDNGAGNTVRSFRCCCDLSAVFNHRCRRFSPECVLLRLSTAQERNMEKFWTDRSRHHLSRKHYKLGQRN